MMMLTRKTENGKRKTENGERKPKSRPGVIELIATMNYDLLRALLLKRLAIVAVLALTPAVSTGAQVAHSGNPIIPGWYADPEAHVF